MAKIENGCIVDVKNEDLKKLIKKPRKFWEGVKFLGEKAFSQCTELKEIKIPKFITISNENPFLGCDKLEKIVVEEGNENLSTDGKALFMNLLYSEDGKILKSLIAYANASGEEYEIPQDVVAISSYAFKGCKNLKKIIFPKLLKSIGWGAFENSGLTEVVVPASVEEVYPEAFKGCKNLNEVNVVFEEKDATAIRKRILSEIVPVDLKTFNELSEEISNPRKIVAKMRSRALVKETLKKHAGIKKVSEREKLGNKFKNLVENNSDLTIKSYEQIRFEQRAKELMKKYKPEKAEVKEPNERELNHKRIMDLVNGNETEKGE